MVQQRPSASCQGGPGIVKDVPPLRECERGADGGTVVEGPARGSRDHRELTAAINLRNLRNLIMPAGRSRLSCRRWTRNNCGMSNDRRLKPGRPMLN